MVSALKKLNLIVETQYNQIKTLKTKYKWQICGKGNMLQEKKRGGVKY